MQELFKGFIPTKDKAPLVKFKDGKNLITLEEAERLPEYAGLLADNVVLIDIDDYDQSEIMMQIVEDLQLNCRVVATNRGKHFYFYGTGLIDKCGTHQRLAVGLDADIKLGDKNSYSLLKREGTKRHIIYDIEPDEDYEPAPAWLTPVRTKTDFTTLGAGDGRNQQLFNYILSCQSAEMSKDEITEAITLLNKYVLPDPLPDDELNKILRDDSFKKPVFYGKNGSFLFDRFAVYLKNTYNVIKLDGQLHVYKDGVYKEGLESIESEMISIIPNISSRNRSEVIKYLKLIAPEVRELADAKYIAFNNGIYNLHTGELEPFTPSIVIKNKIPYDYNYDSYNEPMDTVLDRISCHDDSIRDLLEEMAGYCMYRRNELRKAFILIGDKANGKSTYLDCIAHMLGEKNTSALDLKELGDRFRTAELFGKLVNVGDDIGDEFIPNPAVFKKLVSGDRVTVERKGQDPFDFNNYSKLLFSANSIPRIKDKTGAVLDRLVIVPFNATFSKDDPDYDPYIKYKLREKSAMEYLIQVGLDGLKRVLENNSFTMCEAVQKELDAYNENNNPVLGFFADLDIDADILNQPVVDVYRRYKLYCTDNGYTPISNIEFSKMAKKEFDVDIKRVMIKRQRFKIFTKEVHK